MVLKIKIFVLLLLVSNNIHAQTPDELFFTDKYDANYFSSSNVQNTKMYFGSDLFKFLDLQSLKTCEAYIDSFLNTEEIIFDKNFSFEKENRFKIELGSLNANESYELSKKWSEDYKIDFQKILLGFIKNINFDILELNSDKIIFKKLIIDELTRFYNSANNVNNTNIAFVIPKLLSNNEFNKVFTHYNTKRYSARESDLSATEILYNNKLNNDQIKYIYPSLNRQSFLKNCISLNIIESLFNESISFSTDYNINQCVSSFTISSSQVYFDDFSVFFNDIEISDNDFKRLKNESYNKIISACSENLFYYSFYDIQKLKALIDIYDIKMLNTEIKSINNRNHFVLEVSEFNNFYFKDEKIKAYNFLDFQKKILFKSNALDFENEEDSTLINKLVLFMKINENYSLNIIGEAKRSEYLFITKAKKDSILNKYSEFGYTISRKKDLALFRSLYIFEHLTSSNISFNRLKCIGIRTKYSILKLNLFKD